MGAGIIFIEPQFRYQAETVPLALMGAGFALCVLLGYVQDFLRILDQPRAVG